MAKEMTADLQARLNSFLAQAPDGLALQTDDVVGFWAPEESFIYGIPRGVKLFDSSIEPKRHSSLILFELLQPCKVFTKETGDTPQDAKKGDMVGVWGKPGMRALNTKRLQGVPVWMCYSGEKEIGKPSPMQLFEIRSKGGGKVLEIVSDTRQRSADYQDWVTDQGNPSASRSDYDGDDEEEEEEISSEAGADGVPF